MQAGFPKSSKGLNDPDAVRKWNTDSFCDEFKGQCAFGHRCRSGMAGLDWVWLREPGNVGSESRPAHDTVKREGYGQSQSRAVLNAAAPLHGSPVGPRRMVSDSWSMPLCGMSLMALFSVCRRSIV